MVNHTPPFQTRGKTGEERRGAGRREQTTIGRKETQWCSGITCVLAELRAHYPEHQHEEEEEEEDERQDHTHPSHHRYSTMTQPCRKTHTPNQQYCDSEHAEGAGEESSRTQLAPTRNTPPPFTTRTTTPPPSATRNTRGSRTAQGAEPIDTGHHNTHHSRHSTPPPSEPEGDANTRTGGSVQHRPPFTRNATPPRHATPPSTTPRPPPRMGGGRTEDAPPHEQHGHAHHHAPQGRARNSARHDRSSSEYRTGTGGARGAPLDRADQQHAPPPFNGVHEEDGYHPLIHSHAVHVRTTNERS